MKLAVPDLISPSYFPAIAAAELEFFAAEGLDVEIETVFPVDKAYAALRDGSIDLVGGTAHAALSTFPNWEGVKLLCAQARGMYWFLVMHAELGAQRGDLSVINGRNIGAAPWVEMGLRALLEDAGFDLRRDDVRIAPVPQLPGTGVNFGVMAAQALEDRRIDGFWANGMGAEVAVRRGVGTLVLDVRRGDGPSSAFHYTFSAVAAADRWITARPADAAAVVRAVTNTQSALRHNPELATRVGRKLFPPQEAELIAELIRRDAPYYDPVIADPALAGLNAFARRFGILTHDAPRTNVVYSGGQ